MADSTQQTLNEIKANTAKGLGAKLLPCVERDTLGYAPGASIATQKAFAGGITKGPQYRTIVFPANDGYTRHFRRVRVSHDLQFTGTAPAPAHNQLLFENTSTLVVRVQGSDALAIPLCNLLPHIWQLQGGTAVCISKLNPYFNLPQRLTVFANTQVDVELNIPGTFTVGDLTTDASKPGLLTGSDAYAVFITLEGSMLKPVA